MAIEQQGSKFGISRIISLILILAGISILIFFGFPSTEVNQQLPTPQSTLTLSVAPVQDALAPDFSLLNIEGEQIQLSDFQGQPVLINFWATWCG
jgi:cytochrome oxidase Cu insertion factor (SCO1/SenC/PrrC family)